MRFELLLTISLVTAAFLCRSASAQTHASQTGTASARVLSPLDVHLHWRRIETTSSVTLLPGNPNDGYVYDFAYDFSNRVDEGSFRWPAYLQTSLFALNWRVIRVPDAIVRPNSYDIYVYPTFPSLPEYNRLAQTSNMVLDAPCVLTLNYY